MSMVASCIVARCGVLCCLLFTFVLLQMSHPPPTPYFSPGVLAVSKFIEYSSKTRYCLEEKSFSLQILRRFYKQECPRAIGFVCAR